MKILLVLLASYILPSNLTIDIPKMEKELTDGNVKRWVYERTDATLGGQCTTKVLSFTLSDHTYFEDPCRSREPRTKGGWKVTTNQDGEYILELGTEKYILDIFYETPDFTPLKVMRLRTVSTDITTETSDQFYYAE